MSEHSTESWLLRLSLGKSRASFRGFLRSRLSATSGATLSAIANLVVASLIVFSLSQTALARDAVIWYGILMLVTGTALIFSWLHRSQKPEAALFVTTLLEGLKGILWVAPATILFPEFPAGLQIYVGILLIGAALSCAISWYMTPVAAYAGIGLGLPMGAFWLLFGTESSIAVEISLIMGGGWLAAILLALFLRRHQIGRLRLLYEKNLLAQNVEQKMLELDRLRTLEERSRKEAESANEAKSRFLAHSSHDLRQPLHAINLLLETVPDHELNDRSKEIMARVRHSLDGLTGLFDSLLDLALLDTGQVSVNPTSFSAESFLDQITSEFSEMARAAGVDLRQAPTETILHSDPIILRRLVQNLISNAIQHANGRAVLVGVRSRNNGASIEVYDTGKGISQAEQEKIFQEFERLDEEVNTVDEKVRGLGLGLAIAQRLARVLEVELALNSSPGSGSVFRIVGIPKADSTSIADRSNADEKSLLLPDGNRVAIIDDDPEILRATSDIVQKWGFRTDTYPRYDSDEFIEPDIVLCDFELPGSANGVDTIQSIRARYHAALPAIIITGNTSEEMARAAKSAGLSILYKPVKPAQLRSALLAAAASVRETCKTN